MEPTQLELPKPPVAPVIVPGANAVGEPIFGEACTNCQAPVSTEVLRFLKDTSGRQTNYVKREKGRPVGQIAADLSKTIEGMTFEWDTLGQGFALEFPVDPKFGKVPHNRFLEPSSPPARRRVHQEVRR